MDPYTFSLVTGAVGLGAMAVGGLAAAHGAGQQHDASGGHGGHAGHAGQGHAGHGAHGHDVGGGHASGAAVTGHGASTTGTVGSAAHVPALTTAARGGSGLRSASRGLRGTGGRPSAILWTLLSPRLLFSVALGFGATGMLLGDLLSGVVLFALALLGGVLFEAVVIRPLWNLLARFESTPSMSLESALADEARAVSRFDAAGYGLVAVELNGQVVQVLGTLRADDRALGIVVRAGDRVLIEDVDAARNRCTVAWLGP